MIQSEKLEKFTQFMYDNSISHMIWDWKNFPYDEKYELDHGGDEDYVIITQVNFEITDDHVAERVTVCDFNCDYLNSENFKMYVTAHS